MSDMVQTPLGAGQIIDSENVRGRVSHLVAGTGFKKWFPETQIRVASPEDGWEPIPDDEYRNIYSDAEPDPAAGLPGDPGTVPDQLDPSGSMGDILNGLSEFAATGELSPEDQVQYSGSPNPDMVLGSRGYFLGGPGDNVDHSNSVRLPYNPDPQHDATYATPDASWGPGEYTIDADERLHPSNSLTLNEVPHSEAGDLPGPANHLFAQHVESRRQAGIGEWFDDLTAPEPPYQAQDAHDWMAEHGDGDERLVDSDDIPALMREQEYRDDTAPGLDRAAALRLYGPQPKLSNKYATPLLWRQADHFNDPVQMFRDDPIAMIERRGSTYQAEDGELDRYAALLDVDRQIRTSSWKDVRRKASRLRDSGKVTVKDIGPNRIYASVEGDNGTYETMITKGSSLGGYDAFGPHGDQHVGNWHCSCKWGNWAFKRRFTFIGRLCSHGLASYWEMQAAHNKDEKYVDQRRNKVRTKRAELTFNPNDRPLHRDRGMDELIDHYGPHDEFDSDADFSRRTQDTRDYALQQDALEGGGLNQLPPSSDPEAEFAQRTRDAQDYAQASDLPGDADDVPLGLTAGYRQADFLRTQPRGLTPDLNHIEKNRSHNTVSVTSLEDIDMKGAADEGTLPDDAASETRREAALHLGRRIVGWIVDEVLPQFEEWYAKNHGRQLDQARPTEASQAAAEFAHEAGLDQATTEMLQEFINQDFGPEDLHGNEESEEIKHFTSAAGRYLMAATRHLAAPLAPGEYDSQNPLLAPFNGLQTGNPMTDPLTGPGAGYAPDRNPSNPTAPASATGADLANALTGQPTAVPRQGPGLNGDAPPSTPQASPQVTPTALSTPSAGAGSAPYTVKPGDTLSGIAEKNGLGSDWQSLYNTNKSTVGGNPDLIQPGQQLNLPSAQHGGGGEAPGPAASGGSSSAGSDWFGSGSGKGGVGGSASSSESAPSTPKATSAPPPSSGGGSTDIYSPANTSPGLNNPPAPSSSSGGSSSAGSSAATPAPTPSSGSGDLSKIMPTSALDHRLASDDSLLNHLRDLSVDGVQDSDYGSMQQRNDDVRRTVDELRDRGFDANQLVAMVYNQPKEAAVSTTGGIGSDFLQLMGRARFTDPGEEHPLLGEDAPDMSKAPGGYAGSGPDHQHWATSAEDYVDKHEKKFREDIDSFTGGGDITRYSAFDAALRSAGQIEANAFDNYADWAYARSGGSANPEDWDSVESFLSEAEDRQGVPATLEPARRLINDHLEFRASRHPYLYAANGGYFGVGAQPGYPSSDGLNHSNGAANLHQVAKPNKVHAPVPPNLYMQPPAAPQLIQPPPPQQQLGQPRAPMVQGQDGGTNALGKPKRTSGGISRQAAQVYEGTLNSAFGEMGQPTAGQAQMYGGQPQYHEAGAFPTYQAGFAPPPGYVQGYSGVPGGDPSQHLGGFGWEPLPGTSGAPNEVTAAQRGPSDSFGARGLASYMGTAGDGAPQPQQQYTAHNQAAAAAMGEYRTPHLASYGQTNDNSDVVRQFQAQMGGSEWNTGYRATGPGDADIAAGAHQFLSRTAGRSYSLAEQAALEQESHVLGARNLPELDLTGTHYLEQ